MKYSDPKKLALINASLISLFFLAIYVTAASVYLQINILFLLATAVVLFVFVFLLLSYTVNKFIYNKIKVIYRTIHNFQVGVEKKAELRAGKSLEEVNKEVFEWGDKQNKEIRKLKALAAYRREFLGNVSHELKTPIFNIQGYVLTLLDGGLEDPKINKEYLIRTEKSINRMIAIVEDLETISQLESGVLKLDYENFNIVSLAQEIIEFLEIKAGRNNISVDLNKTYDKPIMVFADKKRIRQVLINLIDNAIKYCRKEDSFAKISFFDMDQNILVEVSDNGIGIDKDNIPRIFERFYRTDKGRSREQGGTGLGLAIVKHIIEAHEQAIQVRSSVGVGTTFGFTLKKTERTG